VKATLFARGRWPAPQYNIPVRTRCLPENPRACEGGHSKTTAVNPGQLIKANPVKFPSTKKQRCPAGLGNAKRSKDYRKGKWPKP